MPTLFRKVIQSQGPGVLADPYRVETYCQACADTTVHYRHDTHTDPRRDAYECVGCHRIVWVPKVPV